MERGIIQNIVIARFFPIAQIYLSLKDKKDDEPKKKKWKWKKEASFTFQVRESVFRRLITAAVNQIRGQIRRQVTGEAISSDFL